MKVAQISANRVHQLRSCVAQVPTAPTSGHNSAPCSALLRARPFSSQPLYTRKRTGRDNLAQPVSTDTRTTPRYRDGLGGCPDEQFGASSNGEREHGWARIVEG